MNIKLIALCLSLMIFILVLDLVRRRRLTFRYALAWLCVSATAVFFAVFHQILFSIAAAIGFELPSNFIFFVLSCTFVLLSLLLTVFLCQQHEQNNIMAQKIAMLEEEIYRRESK